MCWEEKRDPTINRVPCIQMCNGYIQLSNEMSVTLGNQKTSFQKIQNRFWFQYIILITSLLRKSLETQNSKVMKNHTHLLSPKSCSRMLSIYLKTLPLWISHFLKQFYSNCVTRLWYQWPYHHFCYFLNLFPPQNTLSSLPYKLFNTQQF